MTETRSGSTLLAGRYRLAERIGAGAMAEVFRAEDAVLERPVAVKMLHPGVDTGGARDRLRSEVRMLAQLSHPGLVSVYDAGEQDGRGFLVMQLVRGGTLADRIDERPLAPDEVRRIGLRLADVLEYLHGRGLVHRDVKPSNVLVEPTGEVLLTDFGIARVLDAARMTMTGSTVGTAAYMAPEQVQGRPVGPPADVYALGLVLVHALTGEPVYSGSSPLEVAAARLHRRPTVPRAAAGAPLADLLEAMTSTDPGARPPAAEVADRLSSQAARTRVTAAHAAGSEETAVLSTVPVEPPPRFFSAAQVSWRSAVRAVEPAVERARVLWRQRPAQVLGVHAGLAAVVGLTVFALLVMLLVAAAQDGAPGGDRPGVPAPTPTVAPGPERLPADLDRLEQAVRP